MFKFVQIRLVRRYLGIVFFSLDLLWWLSSAFPFIRPKGFHGLELIPVFDIAVLIAHGCGLAVALVFNLITLRWLTITMLWIGLTAYRHAQFSSASGSDTCISELHLMTFNARQFGDDEARLDSLARFVRAQDIGLVCIQEFGLRQFWPETRGAAEAFSRVSGLEHYEFSPHPGNIFGLAVFSRYPIQLDSVIFHGLSRFNEAKAYVLELPGESLNLIHVHMESFNLDSKPNIPLSAVLAKQGEQAKLIESYLGGAARETLICGDLNTMAGSKIYASFSTGRLDVQRAAGLGMLSTYRYFPLRIDHVLCPDSWSVLEADVSAPVPSDHFALTARVCRG